MFDLGGRVALVTGGSRGIGRAIVLQLAKCGASVAINYNQSRQQAESVQAEVKAQGGTAITVQADVRVPEDAERMVQETVESLGRLDILVNNAGCNRRAFLLRMSVERRRCTVGPSPPSPFLCTKPSL